MPHFLNPSDVQKPASRFSQGVVVAAGARRLLISGQVGACADGGLAEGLAGQTEQVFDNLEAVLRAAGMEIRHLVKLVIYCTVPDGSPIVREIRNRRLGSHAPASTYLQVAGLANASYLVEIEGEAAIEA